MITEGKVGIQTLSDGSVSELRTGKTGELVASQLHGQYYEQSSRRQLFWAANQSAQAVSAALATTYTGLCVYNPIGSGVLLSLLRIKFALSVAPAAIATIGLISGYTESGGVTAQTTPLTVGNCRIGGQDSAGIALSAATIVTPTWLAQLYDGFTAASLPAPTPPVDLGGMYTVPPGAFVAIGALTAVTGLGSIVWEEIPL